MPRLMILAMMAALVALAGPAEAKRKKPARVLVYSGTAGFRHDSIPYGNKTIARLGRLTGRWTTKVIETPSELTAERLAKADVVLWSSTTGERSPFADAQERAYMRWIACGGGHMGVHASTDSYKDWSGWAELTGAFFKSHPPADASHQQPEATILVEDQASPLTSPWRGTDSFLLREELYVFDRDPATVISDFRALLAFGGFADPAFAATWDAHYAKEQPLSWTGSYRGLNRIFYTNLGHSTSTWNRSDFQDSLIEAVKWVAGKRPSKTCLRKERIA